MNTLPQPTKYFLYIRKSTDEEDRQVLSLEAQLAELKEYVGKESLEIIETFIEKKTAKVPGREIFNSMLNKIEGGLPHLIGILAWHPDRLSRNSVDGGRLIYLLDTGKLGGLKFPTFAFENNPSGKFFLAIGLSNAKYYVDNLAENVRRGNRAKLRRGEWPGQKPFGYVYDHRLRNIVPEPKEAKIVKKIYEEFATGRHTLKSISACQMAGANSDFLPLGVLFISVISLQNWNTCVAAAFYKIVRARLAKLFNYFCNKRIIGPVRKKPALRNPFASLYAVICCIPQPLNKCIRKCFHPFRLRARIVTLADLSASPSLSKLRAKTPIPCKLEIDLKIVVFLGLFLFSFFPAHCMLTCL